MNFISNYDFENPEKWKFFYSYLNQKTIGKKLLHTKLEKKAWNK
jgi:hypothetical protein